MGLRSHLHLRKPKYEIVMWTVHLTVTALAIIDRFTTNVWPRLSFTIGAGSAGNDRMGGFKEGPWSVVAYDFLARFSGRFSIVCFNFMLISRMHILEQYIASSWIGKYVLDCSNISRSNINAHRLNGIALCVLTLVHVWSILLPCVTHKWSVQVMPGAFEWPLSERAPSGFTDADAANETMSLQVDDIFRMVEMTLLLGVILPLSIRWMSRCWHLGIHVHRFVTVLYFVDIVRRHSHPHSWVLNTPVFVLWILDKVACLFWRLIKSPNVIRERISDDYVALYWTANDQYPNDITAVGSNFFMIVEPSSWVESRHPFTSFKNRGVSLAEAGHYTHGAVIRTFHNARKPPLGGEIRSHTERFVKGSPSSFSIWGPFQGHVTNLIPKAFPKDGEAQERTVVLAGSGSAVTFMIDLMSHLSTAEDTTFDLKNDKLKQVIFLYSTRDQSLYEWVIHAMTTLAHAINKKWGLDKIRIILACTANKQSNKLNLRSISRTFSMSDSEDESDLDSSTACHDIEGNDIPLSHSYSYPSCIELLHDRVDYNGQIPDNSAVFCQGSTGFKDAIAKACRGKEGVSVYFDEG